MKYGDPVATRKIAAKLTRKILANRKVSEILRLQPRIFIASSAYGSLPTAARGIAEEVARQLQDQQFSVELVKIDRKGGFGDTNYATLKSRDRISHHQRREISLSTQVAEKITNGFLLVIDDMRATGVHESAIRGLLLRDAPGTQVAFGYWIGFRKNLRRKMPDYEEHINRSAIRDLNDLVYLFRSHSDPPLLNARLVKFILQCGGTCRTDMSRFLDRIGHEHGKRIFDAAHCCDGYVNHDCFRCGFEELNRRFGKDRALPASTASNEINRLSVTGVSSWSVAKPWNGEFLDPETGVPQTTLLQEYSRFKFGDVKAILRFATDLTGLLISEIEDQRSDLGQVFRQAATAGEYIYLVSPGIRNVPSASNFLLQQTGTLLNVWLTQQRLPTTIIRTLPRLSSGRANYSELNATERTSRPKTTKTLIPASDYHQYPIHVVFIDDMMASGATVARARDESLAAGAMSFNAAFLLQAVPQARDYPELEHHVNSMTVSGRLDEHVTRILSHPDYRPVQRMLRLLLHPRNRAEIFDFAARHIPRIVLDRIYHAAMSNDYLWIDRADDASETDFGRYGESLLVMQELVNRRRLVASHESVVPFKTSL